MKFVLIPMLFICACGSGIQPQHTIAFSPNQEWIQDPLDGAIEFWDIHKASFIQLNDVGTADINIQVDNVIEDTHDKAIAYWNGIFSIGEIHLDKSLVEFDPSYQKAVLCHEMGHSLGMQHIKEPNSLMYEQGAFPLPDGSCPWSEFDQAEFDRVQ